MGDDLLLVALQRRYPVASTVPFNGLDFVHARGSPVEGWMYSRLFWPLLVQVEGMVFLRDSVEDADDVELVKRALSTYQGDKRLTQLSFNTYEVAELFGRHKGDTNDEEDAAIAEVLAQMWRARLQTEFPDRRNHVAVEPADASSGVAISFYSE